MNVLPVVRCAAAAVALILSVSALSGDLAPIQIQQSAQVADTDVIVILRDQMPTMPGTRGAREARAAALAAAQIPILSELTQAGARKIHSFTLVNALAATVTKAEADHLAANPSVQAVVPDSVIRRQPRSRSSSSIGRGGSAGAVVGAAANTASALCNTLEPEALQLTNTAFLNAATPQAQQVLDGNGQLVTGKGVKVAVIATSVDTTLAGFTRPDGSSVFFDNQDFSGDPAGTPDPEDESIGDASAIAAQDMPNGKPLMFDISRFEPHTPVPSPCNIRIRGVAPGASLANFKAFSDLQYLSVTSVMQAIEYAVLIDDVDVINESIGYVRFPDNANDPVALADSAAVQAGVTVVTISGDGGTAGTLHSPGTDPAVITVGGTTAFRWYGQMGGGAIPLGSGGYIDNNISAFSSAGFSEEDVRTVDVVAPADNGWSLCSTNVALFPGCTDYTAAANPSPIVEAEGTSEAAPLTAGEAALVIQAYRSTHRGENPTPALVKQIIMSTATDLGAPSDEQGAGLINVLAAVNAALSVPDANGRPKARGDSLLIAPTSVSIIGAPNTQEVRSFTITNTGSTMQHLAPTLQTLGPPIAGATLNLRLDPAHDASFNSNGIRQSYIKQTFAVPAGVQHLDAAVAFQSPLTSSATPSVPFALLDPSGRQVAFSNPFGPATGYGHVDVVTPVAGTWTAVIATNYTGGPYSYTGPVQFTWAVERYVNFGNVSPAHVDLPPGASGSITATFKMPAQPGDLAAAIRFGSFADSNVASHAEIPVSLRTLIPIGPTGGNFTGILTGSNGWHFGGPTQTFAFDVPKGVHDMSLVLEIADSGYLLEGLLVDPQGMELSVNGNVDPITGASEFALQLYRYNPQPGRWRFIVFQDYFTSGNETSLPFTAGIAFNTAKVTAKGLPNSPRVQLAAGTPLAIPIRVTNTGAVSASYFIDARLNTLATIPLKNSNPNACGTRTLPGACRFLYLPPEVSSVQFKAASSVPITMDAFNYVGLFLGNGGETNSPDLVAQPSARPNTVLASLNVPEVPYGPWYIVPALVGPFGPSGAPTEAVTTSAVVQAQPFDPTVSSDSGDFWADVTLGTSTFSSGLTLAPGQTGTIHVIITPATDLIGSIIEGFLYVDTINFNVDSGDEVVRIPYSYTVVTP